MDWLKRYWGAKGIRIHHVGFEWDLHPWHIDVDLTPRSGGSLLLRVDPRGFFTNVDFAELRRTSDAPPRYVFDDSNEGQPNLNLLRGLQSRDGVYRFSWLGPSSP